MENFDALKAKKDAIVAQERTDQLAALRSRLEQAERERDDNKRAYDSVLFNLQRRHEDTVAKCMARQESAEAARDKAERGLTSCKEQYAKRAKELGDYDVLLAAANAELERVRASLKELVDAMYRYEGDIDSDFPPPQQHRDMMAKARAALGGTDGK